MIIKKNKQSKKIVGIKGWLIFFVIILSLGAIIHITQLFDYVKSIIFLLTYAPAVGDSDIFAVINSMWPEICLHIFTKIIVIGLAIYVLVLIRKHRSLAKKLAIIYLIFNAFALTIDYNWALIVSAYNWAVSIPAEFDFVKILFYRPLRTILSFSLGIIPAIIWIPYFLKSKRVKATLIK